MRSDLIRLELKLILTEPGPEIIQEARQLIETVPRDELPDWVEILANGNLSQIQAVIETARMDRSVTLNEELHYN